MRILKVHESDNITVAIQDLNKGDLLAVNGKEIRIKSDIPAKHKFADQDFGVGDEIIMYGVLVGTAITKISEGESITVRNIKHAASKITPWSPNKYNWTPPDIAELKNKTFMGYKRADGQVGTQNYWIVIPLVFCENRNVNTIRKAFEENLGYSTPEPYSRMVSRMLADYKSVGELAPEYDLDLLETEPIEKPFKNITGIKFLNHTLGCGGTKDDSEALCKLLAGYISNPNVAGATVLSLGCQHAQIPILQKYIRKHSPNSDKPVLYFEQQEYGLERAMLKDAIRQTFESLTEANKLERTAQPISKLVIGVECGGSDGFSGISANPVIGQISDYISALGGKSILSEFPELCGVEQNIVDRCENNELAERFIDLSHSYAKNAEAVGSGFDMNPSPGNVKDGLITDAIKSAGAAKKGGTSMVKDVLDYGDYAKNSGLNLLCTPGNDVESTTGLAGSGANIILFSTGLGTPTGNPICPVIKISSNTPVSKKMSDVIDFNAGKVAEGIQSVEKNAQDLMSLIIETASGEYITKAQRLGQDDFIPWKRGVSL